MLNTFNHPTCTLAIPFKNTIEAVAELAQRSPAMESSNGSRVFHVSLPSGSTQDVVVPGGSRIVDLQDAAAKSHGHGPLRLVTQDGHILDPRPETS